MGYFTEKLDGHVIKPSVFRNYASSSSLSSCVVYLHLHIDKIHTKKCFLQFYHGPV